MKKKSIKKRDKKFFDKLPSTLSDIAYYASFYQENALVNKLLKCCRVLGRFGTQKILTLYYMIQEGQITSKEKLLLLGALGYFILPIDLIPDFPFPLIGFTDDLAVVTIVMKILSKYITPEIKQKAHWRATRIFED